MVLAARGFGRCVGVAGLLGMLMLSDALAQCAGQWQTGALMPSARLEVAVAVVEDQVYVVGGFRGNNPTASLNFFSCFELHLPLPSCLYRSRSKRLTVLLN